MRVVFEGTPEQVLKDMQDYIARLSLMFGDSEEKIVERDVIQEKPAIQPPLQIPEPSPIKVVPEKNTSLKVCKFCSKTFVRIKGHEQFCHENPGAKKHPSAGKRPPWLKRKDALVEKYKNGGFDGNK